MPAASTATRISPGPGTGSGSSPTPGTGLAGSSGGRTARTAAPRSSGRPQVGSDRPDLRRRRGLGLAEDALRLQAARAETVLQGQDVRLQPGVLALEHLDRDLVLADVVVRPQVAEQPGDLAPRVAAEQIGQLRGVLGVGAALLAQGLRAGDRSGHGEQLVGDVDQAEQERLLVLELRLVDEHAVEDLARQPAGVALDEAQVRGEVAELLIARPLPPAEPAGRIPGGVER